MREDQRNFIELVKSGAVILGKGIGFFSFAAGYAGIRR